MLMEAGFESFDTAASVDHSVPEEPRPDGTATACGAVAHLFEAGLLCSQKPQTAQ